MFQGTLRTGGGQHRGARACTWRYTAMSDALSLPRGMSFALARGSGACGCVATEAGGCGGEDVHLPGQIADTGTCDKKFYMSRSATCHVSSALVLQRSFLSSIELY